MPLNKLENFIKNTDGRTLYVNPNDLNATDSITNQGTSLTEPFRTIQRALIESARFSYVRGDDNDLIERTTIVVYPGEHLLDNRPGYGIRVNSQGSTVAVSPSGQEVDPTAIFNLQDDTNFDIESPNNILWHFNSIYGGVVVPRGTSIVGMDLRKTKLRPKYVPNPTDPSTPPSALFRITGSCYFWQFTIFDGNENETVYTDPRDFSENNQSVPTFSHHKLTGFEYCDGVNPAIANGFEQTDLAMYYSKLSNAYNEASGRPIDEKFPGDPLGFAPMRPEFEIVGAFATDPIRIVSIRSGDGFTPDAVVTVDTQIPHGLDVGTPIKIRGVAVSDYNTSTKVAAVLSPTRFTYSLLFVRPNLPASPNVSSATVTVETDTVTGSSPYIFNVSMRSVWGFNGMLADGQKADGFRSMVVAQFTAISLQKDDRSFVKYNKQARRYDSIPLTVVRGGQLSAESSATNTSQVYHLDPESIYRPTWGTTHIKMTNDAVIQIVSVFAIGFNQHFGAVNGADASITNSNSNFGQFALLADGFKNDAFTKDDKGFITQIITPNNAFNPDTDEIEVVDWVNVDFDLTRSVAFPEQLYLTGYVNQEDKPPSVTQGFRIGANYNEVLYQPITVGGLNPETAQIAMVDNLIQGTTVAGRRSEGTSIGRKVYEVLSGPDSSVLTFSQHQLLNGEKIRLFSSNGDLPENVEQGVLYYANVIDSQNIRISTSEGNAQNDIFLEIIGGTGLRVESRVNDKEAGDLGHPIQFDEGVGNWFIHTIPNSPIYQYIVSNPGSLAGEDFVTYFERKPDNRSLEDKLYRVRYVIPKETANSKPPTPGYVLQDSSATGARNNDDFILQNIGFADYEYDRNPRYLVDCTVDGTEVVVRTELPHQLNVGDKINILNVESTNNPDAAPNRSYNGEFLVTRVGGTTGADFNNSRIFRYSTTDVNGFTRNLSGDVFTNNINVRSVLLPRFQRKDWQINAFVYRVEEIVPFTELVRDGIYHLFLVNASNQIEETFTDRDYSQPIEDLYPQLDIDNLRNNPPATTTYAAPSPLGKTTIDELQNSITRETIDKYVAVENRGTVFSTSGINSTTIQFERQHFFNKVYGAATITPGGGYADGTYYDVKLLSNAGTTWKGGTAKVTVVANGVSAIEIMDPGSGYQPGETIDLDSQGIVPPAGTPVGAGAQITITSNQIELNPDTVVQFTGGGETNPDVYTMLDAVPSDVTVTVAQNDGRIVAGMYIYSLDSASGISTYTYNSVEGLSTFQGSTLDGFGLQRGNSFVAFNAAREYMGKFYVAANPSPSTMTAVTDVDLTGVAFIGKTGLEDNDAPTGPGGENIGVRGSATFDNGTFYLETSSGVDSQITVRAADGGATGAIPQKLFLGRYLQVGAEIMRVASTSFSGAQQNIVTVIRGALGTNVTNHPANAKIRAIDPLAIELRRPSILRASGHTFEYLGYGPGNYSTSLPQLQVKQLPENEVYLAQSQELAGGQVVYTGMSDNGDFYIGNTKYSATSGTQTTFDVPIPTIAGEQASSNSVTFDEVIINRRLFVGGGETNEVLSQFDGPVRFSNSTTVQGRLTVNGTSSLNDVVVNNTSNSTDFTNGALAVRGGVGIASDLRVGGTGYFQDVEIEGDVIIDEDRTLFTNKISATNPNADVELYYTQSNPNAPIGIGTSTGLVIFNTEVPGTGPGGELGIQTSTGGVDIKGSLVVREKLIAKEFVGDGLGRPGSVIMWGGPESTIPENYLLCNGALLPKPPSAPGGAGNPETYRKLWDAIGGVHGETATQFNLPDLRDRFIVGAAGNYSVTDTGGLDTVTLNENQLGAHTHSLSEGETPHTHEADLTIEEALASHDHDGQLNNNGSHTHSGSTNNTGSHTHGYLRSPQNNVFLAPGGVSANKNQANTSTGGGGSHSHTVNIPSGGGHTHGGVTVNQNDANHDHDFTLVIEGETPLHNHNVSPSGQTPGTGDADPHENRPPYYALCYIIQFKWYK